MQIQLSYILYKQQYGNTSKQIQLIRLRFGGDKKIYKTSELVEAIRVQYLFCYSL